MKINGTLYNFMAWGKPIPIPATPFQKTSAGDYSGVDFGSAQDKFFAEISFHDTIANINAIQDELDLRCRGQIALTEFTSGQEIFGPEINHSGTINAIVDDFGKTEYPGLNTQALTLKLRAISPTLIGTTPSLSSLRLIKGAKAFSEFKLANLFTYSQALKSIDLSEDSGTFIGEFEQTTAEAKAIMNYLLVSARTNIITMPTMPRIAYPFGKKFGSASQVCNVIDWSIKRKDLFRWIFEITFARSTRDDFI